MAADCTPETLVADAACLIAGMSDHDLLAYIAWQLATNAGVDPTPANLRNLSRCVSAGLIGEQELLAAIAYSVCAAS